MADASIELKGSSFTLTVLHLKTSNLATIRADLSKKVEQAPEFFYLVPILVSIEHLDDSVNYQTIKTLIEEYNFTFVGFTGSVSKEQRNRIRELGFSFVNTAKVNSTPVNSAKVNASQKTDKGIGKNVVVTEAITEKVTQAVNIKPQESTPEPVLFIDKVHRGQVRSGQQIYAKDQNLVIIGSVSAGAEIIADGNIHVYGALRGKAIAGAKGHSHAQIYCQNFEAEMVSINGNYRLSESMEEHWGSPVYIQLAESELTLSKLI